MRVNTANDKGIHICLRVLRLNRYCHYLQNNNPHFSHENTNNRKKDLFHLQISTLWKSFDRMTFVQWFPKKVPIRKLFAGIFSATNNDATCVIWQNKVKVCNTEQSTNLLLTRSWMFTIIWTGQHLPNRRQFCDN